MIYELDFNYCLQFEISLNQKLILSVNKRISLYNSRYNYNRSNKTKKCHIIRDDIPFAPLNQIIIYKITKDNNNNSNHIYKWH